MKNLKWLENKKKIITFLAAIYLDVLTCILLHSASQSWNGDVWSASFFGTTLTQFNTATSDLLLISIFRCIILPLLVLGCIYVGSPHLAIAREQEAMKERRRGGRSQMGASDHEVESLLSSSSNKSITLNMIEEGKINEEPINDNLSERDKLKIKNRADWFKNWAEGLAFFFMASCEVVTGIKSVVLSPHGDVVSSAVLLGLNIFSLNMELLFGKLLIESLTKDEGHMFKAVHPHPLYFTDKVAGNWCNLCRRRALREAYRCDSCDYDLCTQCSKRKNKDRGEGILRGDTGAKEEVELSNWEYFKKSLTFAKPHVGIIALAFIFLTVNSAANLLLPNFQGKILDSVISKDEPTFKMDLFLYIGLSIAMGIFGGVRNLCFNIVGRKMGNEVRNRLYRSVIVQDMAFFDGANTGDLTSRLTQNTTAMISPIQTVLSTLLAAIISLIGGLVMCIYTSWRLSFLAFTTVGPIILIVRAYAKWSRNINGQIWAAYGDANSFATQALTNIRTVRAFSTEPKEIEKYECSTKEALDKGIKDAFAGAGTYALTEYIELSISVLLLWYGGSVAMSDPGVLTVGKLITFQLYWNMLRNSYSTLTDNVNAFTKAGGAAQRVLTLMDNLPDISPDEGEKDFNLKGDIELQNVEYFYQMRPEMKVLKGVNLKINSGQVCAFVGKSGGGKSTLVHLLMRFYDPKGGRILIDGKDLKSYNPIKYHDNVGIVAQDTQLFNMSIEENIAYGVDHYTTEELHEAARNANCHDFIMELDEQYETKVGDHGVRMSGGQKQRIALARVFLRKPKLLFLDEATSALDAESEALVQESIDKLIQRGGCTVILVAHRLSTVINADKIAVVNDGVITEQGNHEELLEKNGIYARLVARQMKKMQNTLDESALKVDPKKPADTIDSLMENDA